MTKEEFETIIKPIMLLNSKQSKFIRTALLGNFQKWNEQKQSDTHITSGYSIKFSEIDSNGIMYSPDSLNIENLNKLKVSGQIKEFKIDKNGVKVIKYFKPESGSL